MRTFTRALLEPQRQKSSEVTQTSGPLQALQWVSGLSTECQGSVLSLSLTGHDSSSGGSSSNRVCYASGHTAVIVDQSQGTQQFLQVSTLLPMPMPSYSPCPSAPSSCCHHKAMPACTDDSTQQHHGSKAHTIGPSPDSTVMEQTCHTISVPDSMMHAC